MGWMGRHDLVRNLLACCLVDKLHLVLNVDWADVLRRDHVLLWRHLP